MTAPFDLPDTCTIYANWNTGVIKEDDVPCRQVPRWKEGLQSIGVSNGVGWTHWVDFNPTSQVDDGQGGSAGGTWTFSVGDSIFMILGGHAVLLVVLWVEDRFTNTDKHYIRAYCTRQFRDSL